MDMERFTPLLAAIDRSLAGTEKAVAVAIDGMAASGKTTLAAALAEKYGAPVVHMDDFFLRPEQRTPERYAQPGGNIDWERFLSEVCPYLATGEGFSYFRFDCHRMCLAQRIVIPPHPLIIVEGTYSLHPKFLSFYTIKAMLTISQEWQAERIQRRNGQDGYRIFAEKWMPLENRYFSEFHVEMSADFVFNG